MTDHEIDRKVVPFTEFLQRRSRGVGQNRITARRPLDQGAVNDVWNDRKETQQKLNRERRACWYTDPGPEAA